MKHPDLKLLKSHLNNYYCYFKSDDVMAISEDKALLPFIQVICNDKESDHFLLSVAMDYPNAELAIDVALICSKIRLTALTEPFFISNNGSTYMGNEAREKYSLEQVYPLDQMIPLTDSKH